MILERAKRNMNKQKSVILSIALLSALSAGITADAREGWGILHLASANRRRLNRPDKYTANGFAQQFLVRADAF